MAIRKKYSIINTSEIDSVVFSETLHVNARAVRINNNGTKCVISYIGRQPVFLGGKTEHTKQEIEEMVNSASSGWQISASDLEDGSWKDRVGEAVKGYSRFSQWF